MSKLVSRLFCWKEEPAKGQQRRIFSIFFWLFLVIAAMTTLSCVMSIMTNDQVTISTIEFESIEWTDLGEFDHAYSVRIESTDGRVFKIDPILTDHMDLIELRSFLQRVNSVEFTVHPGNWIVGIVSGDEVFFEADYGIQLLMDNDRLGLATIVPICITLSLHFGILTLGVNKIKNLFIFKRKTHDSQHLGL